MHAYVRHGTTTQKGETLSLETALFDLIENWYITTGYFGIVLAMAIESCCIPLPSEIVMPVAGYFVIRCADPKLACLHQFSLLGVAAAGAVGCLIGSIVAYGIGQAG